MPSTTMRKLGAAKSAAPSTPAGNRHRAGRRSSRNDVGLLCRASGSSLQVRSAPAHGGQMFAEGRLRHQTLAPLEAIDGIGPEVVGGILVGVLDQAPE